MGRVGISIEDKSPVCEVGVYEAFLNLFGCGRSIEKLMWGIETCKPIIIIVPHPGMEKCVVSIDSSRYSKDSRVDFAVRVSGCDNTEMRGGLR